MLSPSKQENNWRSKIFFHKLFQQRRMNYFWKIRINESKTQVDEMVMESGQNIRNIHIVLVILVLTGEFFPQKPTMWKK